MQRWRQTGEAVLCAGVKKCTLKKKGRGKRTDVRGCAVDSFLLDSVLTLMSVRPRFLSLMACAPVIKE